MYTIEQYIHMQSVVKILDMKSIAVELGHDLVCPVDLLSPWHNPGITYLIMRHRYCRDHNWIMVSASVRARAIG